MEGLQQQWAECYMHQSVVFAFKFCLGLQHRWFPLQGMENDMSRRWGPGLDFHVGHAQFGVEAA